MSHGQSEQRGLALHSVDLAFLLELGQQGIDLLVGQDHAGFVDELSALLHVLDTHGGIGGGQYRNNGLLDDVIRALVLSRGLGGGGTTVQGVDFTVAKLDHFGGGLEGESGGVLGRGGDDGGEKILLGGGHSIYFLSAF